MAHGQWLYKLNDGTRPLESHGIEHGQWLYKLNDGTQPMESQAQ